MLDIPRQQCSFCQRTAADSMRLFGTGSAGICDNCVVDFYAQLPGPFPPPGGSHLKKVSEHGQVLPERSPQPRPPIDSIVYEARSRAARIIADADLQAQELLEQARAASQRLRLEAWREGYDRGRTQKPPETLPFRPSGSSLAPSVDEEE